MSREGTFTGAEGGCIVVWGTGGPLEDKRSACVIGGDVKEVKFAIDDP